MITEVGQHGVHIAHAHKLHPFAAPNRKFRCYRCKRDLPENCYHPVGETKELGRRPAAILLHPICFTCRKQQKSEVERSPLYSPALHRFMARVASGTRARAKMRGIVFALTVDDILAQYLAQDGRCALTGAVMEVVRGDSFRNRRVVSVDRIDSSGNYTIANTHLVCAVVNMMKNDMTLDEFRLWCAAVVVGDSDD